MAKATSNTSESVDQLERKRRRHREYMREYQRRNPEKKKALDHAYWIKNKDKIRVYKRGYSKKNAAKEKARVSDWYKANPDRAKEIKTAHYLANTEKIKARSKQWAINNPESAAENSRRSAILHQQRKRTALQGDPKPIREFYKHVRTSSVVHCSYCNRSIPKGMRQVDHVVPLSRGGHHSRENLAASCGMCNRSKNTKTPDEFRAYLAKRRDIESRRSQSGAIQSA